MVSSFCRNHYNINNVFIREYSCWLTHPIATAVGAFVVFTNIAMLIGVLTVCFTSAKPTSKCFCSLYKNYFSINKFISYLESAPKISKERYNNQDSLNFE
jgi:hypothetical protein